MEGQSNLREDHVVLELRALHPTDNFGASTSAATSTDIADRGHTSDDVAECRICLDDLSEGGETLILECSCRGELALAHRECAITWFSQRGNNTCEVCNHIIQNLPLELLTIPRTTPAANQHAEVDANRGIFLVCQEMPELVAAGVFAYFFFLLTYLEMGDITLVVALMLSCILGYLSAITSTLMARGRYIWVYGMVQFCLVVISVYVLRSMVKGKQPLLYLLFASLMGFGVPLCCVSIIVGALKIRTWWLQQHQQGDGGGDNNN